MPLFFSANTAEGAWSMNMYTACRRGLVGLLAKYSTSALVSAKPMSCVPLAMR